MKRCHKCYDHKDDWFEDDGFELEDGFEDDDFELDDDFEDDEDDGWGWGCHDDDYYDWGKKPCRKCCDKCRCHKRKPDYYCKCCTYCKCYKRKKRHHHRCC